MERVVVGRDAELAEISEQLEHRSASLAAYVLAGEAGIGKTTLWRFALGAAPHVGFRTLSCGGVAAEAELSYAALSDLLAPLDRELSAGLPEPQLRALDSILLSNNDGGAPLDQRLIGTALAGLLTEACAESPLMLAIDDAQWLDSATDRALGFALRRLSDAPILIVATMRTGPDEIQARLLADIEPGRTVIRQLGGLPDAALYRIVSDDLGRAIPRPALRRISRAARGNPFFVLELARHFSSGGDDDLSVVPTDVRAVAAVRVGRLPAATRKALLVASALSRPTVALVDESHLEPAVAAGIVYLDRDDIVFVHPVFADAIYRSTSSARIRAVHRSLAARVTDPEERARHLALSASGPREAMAEVIEAAASGARENGALDSAAELAKMAFTLTPVRSPRDVRARRAVAAATNCFHSGDTEAASELTLTALSLVHRGRQRGEALRLLAEIRFQQMGFDEALDLLREAVLQDDSPDLVVPTLLALAFAEFSVGDLDVAIEHAAEALDHARRSGSGPLIAEALATVAAGTAFAGGPVDWDGLAEAVRLEDRSRQVPLQMRPSVIAAEQTCYLGRLIEARDLLYNLRDWFLERGEESDLPYLLVYLAGVLVSQSAFEEAVVVCDDAVRLTEQAGFEAVQGLVLAHRSKAFSAMGEIGRAELDLARSAELLEPTGWVEAQGMQWGATTFFGLTAGRTDVGVVAAHRVADAVARKQVSWPTAALIVADAIEILIEADQLDAAESLHQSFVKGFDVGNVTWLDAAMRRAQGLLLAASGDIDGALVLAGQAVSLAESGEMPLELVRSLVVLGRLQRRSRRRGEARRCFERAAAICEEIGAAPWLERVGVESGRLGVRSDPGRLTATEQEVAIRAAGGETNREIAAKLFISRRTVEANLRSTYAKLGIRSRAQLALALPAVAAAEVGNVESTDVELDPFP